MLRSWFHRFLLVFIVLYLLMIPFGYQCQPGWINGFATRVALFTQQHVFPHANPSPAVSSDSLLAWIALLNAIIIAIVVAVGWQMIRPAFNARVYTFIALRYFVALHLLIYGFSKLFKVQFYLPEPNTLYTTIGNTPRDLLYWSVMGLSRPYSIFLGGLEIIGAGILLFRRTVAAGAIVATGVLLNVFAINLAFDISVKMHSGVLLLFSMMIAWMVRQRWLPLLGWKNVSFSYPSPLPLSKKTTCVLKAIVIIGLLAESCYPYLNSRNFNDDRAARPLLHGVYEIKTFIFNGDTLPPLTSDTARWRRIFIHRDGYCIIQDMQDQMQDYKISSVQTARDSAGVLRVIFQLQEDRPSVKNLVPVQFVQIADSLFTIQVNTPTGTVQATAHRLNWEKLPALKKEFSWFAEGDER